MLEEHWGLCCCCQRCLGCRPWCLSFWLHPKMTYSRITYRLLYVWNKAYNICCRWSYQRYWCCRHYSRLTGWRWQLFAILSLPETDFFQGLRLHYSFRRHMALLWSPSGWCVSREMQGFLPHFVFQIEHQCSYTTAGFSLPSYTWTLCSNNCAILFHG